MRKTIKTFVLCLIVLCFGFCSGGPEKTGETATATAAAEPGAKTDFFGELVKTFPKATGLQAEIISYENIVKGVAPPDFEKHTGAAYKPSHNEDPAIPAQCWIETGYGTQNACKYCHTDYLASIKHGNGFPIGEDQVLYSFPAANLNKINWKNITHPQELMARLEAGKPAVPQPDDPKNLTYVREDNWAEAYGRARPDGDTSWNNPSQPANPLQLFPALDPRDLFPFREKDPTGGGAHGYIDKEGFIKNKKEKYTGWRAVNFFPYAIFTPLTGSVSGIYIRLPKSFMTASGALDIDVYKRNLDLLEKVIKNDNPGQAVYYGDASKVKVQKGFYPVGTEFAHPLHYVDLEADGESAAGEAATYEFPGTRSKRVKEIRYMYKWKEVDVNDIAAIEDDSPYARVVGKEWKGWLENQAGWVLAAYIENREGRLRPQTTEELLQCLGCHSSVGNTIDAVWSFQRKLPGDLGWKDMNYGFYNQKEPDKTRLNDYQNENIAMGELEYFYYSVVGADLFGIMPAEIKAELTAYTAEKQLVKELGLKNPPGLIFDDEKLKATAAEKRKDILEERSRIMRHYARSKSYLYQDKEKGEAFLKGKIFYPSEATMKANIAGYRRILLDQSFNLGKGTFGDTPEAIPFTLRSDGTVKNAAGEVIPAGGVITSRPYGKDGVGTTPTGIAAVNGEGEPVDEKGAPAPLDKDPKKVKGHVSTGGTFDMNYNPIIKKKLKKD